MPVVVTVVFAVLAPIAAGAQETPPTAPEASVPPVTDPPPDPAAGDPTGEAPNPEEISPADAPAAPAPLDPTPHVRVLVAHFTIFDSRARLEFDQAARDEAQMAAVYADLAVVAGEQQLAVEQASLETAHQEMRQFAVGMFIHAEGGVPGGSEIEQLSVFRLRRTKQLTDSVLDHRVDMIHRAEERIEAAVRTLDERRAVAAQAAGVLGERNGVVADAERQLRESEQELRAAQRADTLVPYQRDPDDENEFADDEQQRSRNDELADADPESTRQWELTIEGNSIFTPEELAAWFAQFQVMPTRAGAPATDLARWFVEEGTTEGLRGDVSFAQAILETGSFTNLDTVNHNNYSGIGHCDSCPSGWTFPSPQAGVRAQIQLLKSYIYERPEYQHELVDRRLRGPAGCCQTWNELSGVWASAGGYSAHIMRIYQDMLEWLYRQRTGSAPPPRPDGPPPA